MKVFLTGATGYIGSEVARALARGGHQVVGLTHTPAKAGLLKSLGATPALGDLKDPKSWRRQAEAADALVHCGFEYGPDAAAADRAALEALLEACRAGDRERFLLYTSGVWVLGERRGAAADEATPPKPLPIVAWRPDHEKLALDAPGGRAAVLRPGCVYGGAGGLYGMMFKSAVEDHRVRVVGGGQNRWAAVYLDDLAELYRLILERGAAGVFHATDGSSDPLRSVAEAFLDAAGGGTVEATPLEKARKAMGPLADALALDQRVSSGRAAKELGWKPRLTSPMNNAMLLLKQWRERVGPASVA